MEEVVCSARNTPALNTIPPGITPVQRRHDNEETNGGTGRKDEGRREASATKQGTTTRTAARAVNEPRRPIFGMSTKPANNEPTTAPKVFQVRSRPTRSPSKSDVSEAIRIDRGNTEPSAAAGRPRTSNGNRRGKDLMITVTHQVVVETAFRGDVKGDEILDVEHHQAN